MIIKSTIIIRSFNRIHQLKELLDSILLQTIYFNIEIIVVDQSNHDFKNDSYFKNYISTSIDSILNNNLFFYKLNSLVELKIIAFREPIGGPQARNVGFQNASSDLCIFIDDDDLPIGSDWILKHVNAHQDYPNMIGLTGRHLSIENEICPYLKIARPFISKKVLSYNFLKFPYTFARFDESVEKVKWVHGTNSSIKKEWITKVGGWDDSVKNQDEHSFAFKIAKIKGKENYFSFDANIPLLRRTDIPGGMGKRTFSISREIKNQWSFITKIVKTYHPVRFYLLFPIYIILIIIRLIQKALTRLPKP